MNTDQFRDFLALNVSGVGGSLMRVRPTTITTYPFPLPPLPEQQRIVDEIEAQLTRLDAVVAALKRTQATLKRYRASILKTACEGRLVPQNPNDEPASQILERILTERRQQWNGRGPYTEPTPPDTSDLPELPVGWVWASSEMLAAYDTNSIAAGPFGTIFKAKDFRLSGVPIIFLRHVAPGRYLRDYKPTFMDRKKWDELFQSYSVYGGELLVTKLGEPPGVCAIYPSGIGPAMVTPDVIKMSVNKAVASTDYLMYYFNSQVARRFAFGAAFGTTRLRLTLPIFRNMPIPLPPLAEQQRIVEEVERRLSVMDEVEATLEANLKRAERLRQSILKRAFEGKLVPQNPADEPASVLLGRISEAKAKAEAKKEQLR